MLKTLAWGSLLVLFLLGLFYRSEISYGWMQATGQIKILMNVKEVEDVMNDPSFPDSLKKQILLIQEIKQFGVDSLGLNPSNNYTTFYDQKGKPILWVITASDRYQLKALDWKFPLIGTFSYKGFFDSTKAALQEAALIQQGYDTDMNEVSAWSTLGYFKDPILSSMLYRSKGALANLILHELTHGTLFVKDNLEMNENLASFVGDIGATKFLTQRYGSDSPELKKYEFSKKYNNAYAQHILRGAQELDSLYATFKNKEADPKQDSLKKSLIVRIDSTADTLLSGKVTFTKKWEVDETKLPNNAYFIGYQTYKSKQNAYRKEFEEKFNGDFKKYMNYLKAKYSSL